jgi:hypothetical protein
MIIIGAVLVAVGAAALLDLPWAPALLIGLGAGMVVSGVTGRLGWPSGRARARALDRSRDAEGERAQPG